MADINDELAAIEAASAQAMLTAPAAPAAPVITQPDPTPGSVVTVEVPLGQPTPPAPQPQPAPQPEPTPQPQPQPAPEPNPQPAPQPEPAPGTAPAPEGVVIPDKTPRRVYTHPGMSDENKLLLSLIDANPGLSLDAIMAAASAQLGKPVMQTQTPQPAPQPEPGQPTPVAPQQPTAPAVLTYEAAETRLEQIETSLANLDPVINAEEWKALTIEQNKLARQMPRLAIEAQQQQQIVAAQEDQIIAAVRAEVSQNYPAITPQVIDTIFDPSKPLSAITDPFAQAVAVRMRQDMATNSPLLDAPDYEALVVAAVAQQHGVMPTRRPQATSPQAAPNPPAAPAPQGQQPQTPAGQQPLQVMPAVPGTQHTSADRVTTVPPNPQANLQVEYQQAVAANDFAAIERLSGLMAAGGNAPAIAMPAQIIGISYSGAAA